MMAHNVIDLKFGFETSQDLLGLLRPVCEKSSNLFVNLGLREVRQILTESSFELPSDL